jgi:hypothetical protein
VSARKSAGNGREKQFRRDGPSRRGRNRHPSNQTDGKHKSPGSHPTRAGFFYEDLLLNEGVKVFSARAAQLIF